MVGEDRKLAEAAVAEVQRNLLAQALEHLTQGITILDRKLRLVVWNRRFRELLDFPESLCRAGTGLDEFFRLNAERGEYGAGDVEELVRQRMELARRGVPHRFERTRANGTVVEVIGTPLPGGGFVTTYTDVTVERAAESALRHTLEELDIRVAERTQALQEREQALAKKTALLEATLEHMNQGISLVGPDLRMQVHNRRFLELLQFPDELGVENTPLEAYFRYNAQRGEYGPGDVEALVAARMELARHPVPHRMQRTRPDGTVIEVEGNPLPDHLGGFVTTYTDITDLVRAKERAEKALADLEMAQNDLVRAEKMASLGQLVAGVAHEINTPVGVALTAASHLEFATDRLRETKDAGRMKNTELASYLDDCREAAALILSNLRRAARLIESFKQVAVDQTTQERRTFNLLSYLNEVLAGVNPQLKQSGLAITVACPEQLELDTYPGALAQVLTNLLINTVRHAYAPGQRGQLHLTATMAGGWVQIVVADDGKGIPPEHLGRIFDPFFTTSRSAGGSGLGLHIVYNLVTQNLGGKISCASTLGQGTRFTLRIPQAIGKGD